MFQFRQGNRLYRLKAHTFDTLQTLPDGGDDPVASVVGKVVGTTLHTGVAAGVNKLSS